MKGHTVVPIQRDDRTAAQTNLASCTHRFGSGGLGKHDVRLAHALLGRLADVHLVPQLRLDLVRPLLSLGRVQPVREPLVELVHALGPSRHRGRDHPRADEADLLVVAAREVFHGDRSSGTRTEVGEETVLLEDGQGCAVRGVADDEDAGPGGKALYTYIDFFVGVGGVGGWWWVVRRGEERKKTREAVCE